MKKYWIVLLAAIILGCGGGDEPADNDGEQSVIPQREGRSKMIPFEVGARWIFETSGFDTTAQALKVFRVDTFSVVSDTMIDKARWYQIDGLGGEIAYATNWNDGLYYARSGEKPFLFAKNPAQVGDTFTSMIGEVEAHTRVAAIGEEVRVPAGTFYCHKYVQTVGPRKVVTNYYFAPGLGLVKMEVLNRAGTLPIYKNELIKIERE